MVYFLMKNPKIVLQFTAGDRKGRPYAYVSTDSDKYKFAVLLTSKRTHCKKQCVRKYYLTVFFFSFWGLLTDS